MLMVWLDCLMFFLFKHKTAYDMRISYWSSDVCSSDLKMHANGEDFVVVDARNSTNPTTNAMARRMGDRNRGIGFNQLAVMLDCEDADARLMFRSEERRVGKECGSKCRYRW